MHTLNSQCLLYETYRVNNAKTIMENYKMTLQDQEPKSVHETWKNSMIISNRYKFKTDSLL